MAPHCHTELKDEHLLKGFVDGCQGCFATLFQRYWSIVFRVASKTLRDRAEAEDILQEVFLIIFLHPERFDETKGSFRTWVFQLCYYRSLMRRRYLSARGLNGRDKCDPDRAAGPPDESSCETQDPYLTCLVERSLALISARQRRVLQLVHFEGYTLREISELLNETLATTRNNYYRGLKTLRGFLDGNVNGEQEESDVIVTLTDPSHV